MSEIHHLKNWNWFYLQHLFSRTHFNNYYGHSSPSN